MKKKNIIENHFLMPKHTLCTEKEKDAILAKYVATENEMPKIKADDGAIQSLGGKVGDMVKVERLDPLVGKTYFYRVITNE